jgi:hypothetical protein
VIDTYPSCNPEIGLTDIHHCYCYSEENTFSLAPGHYFKAELMEGTTYPISGFPSLSMISLSSIDMKPVKLNVFGSDSRYRTLILSILNSTVSDEFTVRSFESLIGQVVYVNYPQVHEAKVIGISSEEEELQVMEHHSHPHSSHAAPTSHHQSGNQNNKSKQQNNHHHQQQQQAQHHTTVTPQSTSTPSSTTPEIKHLSHDDLEIRKWKTIAETEEKQYLAGRGLPGTGGISIGTVKFMVKVKLLQGLKRDPITGATKKVYSSSNPLEIPIQLILLNLPHPDHRFDEISELTVDQLMPYGSSLVAVSGPLIGCCGTVIGPHHAAVNGKKQQKKKKSDVSLPSPTHYHSTPTHDSSVVSSEHSSSISHPHYSQPTASSTALTHLSKGRIVDVEFHIPHVEVSFGYKIAKSLKEQYYSSRETCSLLKISSSTLGKISGTVRIEPNRVDLGLNLKRKGMYQLVGYVRKVDMSTGNNYFGKKGGQGQGNYQPVEPQRNVWKDNDSVKLIGMEASTGGENNSGNGTSAPQEDTEAVFWEYSNAAIALIGEYKEKFPQVFISLEKIQSNSGIYSVKEFFPNSNADQQLSAILEWMKNQPFYSLPRTSFTTMSLSR